MEGECTVCGKELCTHPRYTIFTEGGQWHWRCLHCDESGVGTRPATYFVPMYEGEVVDPNTHEWAGYDACQECSDKSVALRD